MKGKIIRAFMGVYLAVSMIYGGVRAAYLTISSYTDPQPVPEVRMAAAPADSFGVEVTGAPIRESGVLLSPVPEAAVSEAPAEPEVSAPAAEASSDEEEALPEETPGIAPEEAEPEDIEAQEAEPAEAEPAEAEPEAAPETLTEAPEADDDEEEAYLEAAPAEDVPSLEDYLSTLHCGRCGRNCYLSSPHCRTGRSKASGATEEYYEIYGSDTI